METPMLNVDVPSSIQGTNDSADAHGNAENSLRLASKLADARPGEVHFVITSLPFEEDETMQEVVRLMRERVDHLVHINCAGLTHNEVLYQIDFAGATLSTYEGRFMRLAIVCTDLPCGLGKYLSDLSEAVDDLRAIGASLIVSTAPESELMLGSMGSHERHYPLDYHGPIEPRSQALEDRGPVQVEPLDILISLCLPTFMTVDEASRLIRVSPERLRRLIRRGEIEGAVYVGTKLRIRTNALLNQYGISAREALPNIVNVLDCLYEIFVQHTGAQDHATA